MIERHVKEGRHVLNFSDWDNQHGEARSYHEMAETLLEGEMPPRDYLAQHPDARLSAAERQALLDGLKATLDQSGSSGDNNKGD